MLLHRLAPVLFAGLLATAPAALANCPLLNSVPERTPDHHFSPNNDATVTHDKTGLIWKRCAEGQTWDGSTCTGTAATYLWADALIQAKNTNFAGKTGWRLPNVKELESLVETGCIGTGPFINQSWFPATPSGAFWSGSNYAPDAAYAWRVDFANGGISGDLSVKGNSPYFARLVRGGQLFDSFDSQATTNTTTLTRSPNNDTTAGQSVTLTASVGNNNVGGGSVVFKDNGAMLTCDVGSAALSGLTATCVLSGLSTGSHAFTAEFWAMPPDNAAASAPLNHTVNAIPVSITFNALADQTLGAADFQVSASGEPSGNPVSFSSLTVGQCTLTDHGNSTATVHLVARGTCTIRASQLGSSAPDVDRSFFVYQNVELNDTGQTLCYDTAGATVACSSSTYPRQDGRFGRDAAASTGNLVKTGGGQAGFDFTPLDANGTPIAVVVGLPAAVPVCVRDNVTRLIWEIKTVANRDTLYTFNTAPNLAVAVNASGLCGLTGGWRVPTRRELYSLLSFSGSSTRIDSDYFPNTVAADYWSSSPYQQFNDRGWTVHFGNAYANRMDRTTDARVRLVHTAP